MYRDRPRKLVDKPCITCGHVMRGVDPIRRYCDKCLVERRTKQSAGYREDMRKRIARGEQACRRRNPEIILEETTCLKCDKKFMSYNKKSNRICNNCRDSNYYLIQSHTHDALMAPPI